MRVNGCECGYACVGNGYGNESEHECDRVAHAKLCMRVGVGWFGCEWVRQRFKVYALCVRGSGSLNVDKCECGS